VTTDSSNAAGAVQGDSEEAAGRGGVNAPAGLTIDLDRRSTVQPHFSEHRIHVWVQPFKGREHLMLQWHDPDTGKRRSKSAGTSHRGLAEMKRTDLEYQLNHGLHQEASRMTWEKFRELFEDEHVAGTRPGTRHNYKLTLDAFERLCRPGQLRSVTERTVSAFLAALRREPGVKPGTLMQAGTIKIRMQFLHTALVWAAGQKFLPECPRFPAVKVPRRKPSPVAVEAFERLLARAPDRQTHVFLLCGWLAGLRLGEALALEWDETAEAPWLDLARGRIWLPAGFVKAVEDQWVPLDLDLREALESLPRHGRKVFHFVEERSGKPVGLKAVGNRITELARAAGVRMTMKTLRQGFGCRYAGQVSAQVLQRLMRHSNIRVTMDYYANVDAAVEDAVRVQRNNRRNTRPAEDQPRAGQGGENRDSGQTSV
jgi:integrase